jgi:hypothetical protein
VKIENAEVFDRVGIETPIIFKNAGGAGGGEGDFYFNILDI